MSYLTIRAGAEDSFVERRSRFIGHILPVQQEAEAIAFIEQMRQQYWDANHNVYAYILREGNLRRYSDDGEPQGTAGLPVLDVLQKEGLTDVCVVVTRYFGGILLGGGGLVRAYTHGAKIAVDAAERMQMCECLTLRIQSDYGLYGKINYLLPQFGILTLDSDFGAEVTLTLRIRRENRPGFEKKLQELSAGSIRPEVVEEGFAEMPEI
ncbi:MAG: YigZ family protein [Provencibacterium sp.]|jgi:uncharacterized YigZ family protein|nr:YigZ family protein [Provencibacterium sp.]